MNVEWNKESRMNWNFLSLLSTVDPIRCGESLNWTRFYDVPKLMPFISLVVHCTSINCIFSSIWSRSGSIDLSVSAFVYKYIWSFSIYSVSNSIKKKFFNRPDLRFNPVNVCAFIFICACIFPFFLFSPFSSAWFVVFAFEANF